MDQKGTKLKKADKDGAGHGDNVEAELEKHRHHLEELVKDRTAQLEKANARLKEEVEERKRAQEELFKNRQMLQAVIEGTSDAVYVKDTWGRYLLLNSAASKAVGKSPQEVLGKDDTFIFPAGEAKQVMDGDKSVLAGGVPKTYEEVVTTASGQITTYLSTKGPLFDENGELSGLFGVARDITDRKRAEEQLSEALKKLDLHMENSPLAVIEWGPDFRLSRWNAQAETVFGWRADEVIGKRLDEFRWVHDEDVEKVAKVSAALLGGSQPRIFSTNRNYRKDGSVIECEWYNSSIVDEFGELVSILSLVLDITDRKRAEEALRQSEERLRKQTDELEQIIGVVSHDLRAPLVNVRGFNKFIQQDTETLGKLLAGIEIPEQVQKQLESILGQSIPEASGFIESSADAMNTLVKSLVEVARAGLAVVKPERLEMNEIIRKIISSLEIKFKDAGARVRVDDLPPCWADRTQIAQAFTNLIDNAVKYLDSDRPGQICIGGAVTGDHVTYCIADNGIGIAAEDQEKIFEIFTRLASKAHAGGEGMGLTMVKRMIDRNNGKIWVESEKGKGSNFFISLPLPPPT